MYFDDVIWKKCGKEILNMENFHLNGECVRLVLRYNKMRKKDLADLLDIVPSSVSHIYFDEKIPLKVRKALCTLIPYVNFYDDKEFIKYLSSMPVEFIRRVQYDDIRRYQKVGEQLYW